MSVQLVEFKTLNSVFRTLLTQPYHGNGGTLYNYPYEELQRLARKLNILNHKSYRIRYRTNKSSWMKYKASFNRGDILQPYQLLKSMQYVAYQIDEDNNSPMQLFKAAIDELTNQIINNTDEYKKAEWGI